MAVGAGMTKYCGSCHTANRERAKYCIGCAGRFSGIRSGTTTFDTLPGRTTAPPPAQAFSYTLKPDDFQPWTSPEPKPTPTLSMRNGARSPIVWLVITLAVA